MTVKEIVEGLSPAQKDAVCSCIGYNFRGYKNRLSVVPGACEPGAESVAPNTATSLRDLGLARAYGPVEKTKVNADGSDGETVQVVPELLQLTAAGLAALKYLVHSGYVKRNGSEAVDENPTASPTKDPSA